MAGFVGICGPNAVASTASVSAALGDTVYSAKAASRIIHSDAAFVLGKSFFSFLESSDSAEHAGDVSAWLDGEVFNAPDLAAQPGESFVSTLIRHYRRQTLDKLLPRVDGVYIAVIYDRAAQQIRVVTDRYGLRPFYVCHRNNHFVMAPEVKCFARMPQTPVAIRKDVVDCFMRLEHLLGDATWLEHVVLAAPATVYTYALATDRLTTQRYWSWSQIRRSSLSFNEAAEALAESLHRANKIRATGIFDIGVALSGGLDSRAILAAVYEQKPVTYTFGIEGSPDVKIARRVAALAGVKHVYYDMHVADWLPQRFSGVWKTDGMFNMYHMHYSHLMNAIPTIMDVNLSGFLGDAVIGGSYLGKKGKSFLNTRITPAIAQHYYGPHYTLSDPADSFFDLDKIDPYLFFNRGRRMIGMGAEEAAKTIPQRLPFMDVALMDLAYSLPDEYRAESRVYNKALLLQYPAFYKNIPDATSGLPIAENPTLKARVHEKINWLIYAVKYKLGIPTSFTDVYNWIKEPATAQMIRTLLDRRTALYANYTDHDYVDLYLTPHVQGKRNYMKQVMGAVTVEIWLQQLLNNKYRPETEG